MASADCPRRDGWCCPHRGTLEPLANHVRRLVSLPDPDVTGMHLDVAVSGVTMRNSHMLGVTNVTYDYIQPIRQPATLIYFKQRRRRTRGHPCQEMFAQCDIYWKTNDTSGRPNSALNRSSCILPSSELGKWFQLLVSFLFCSNSDHAEGRRIGVRGTATYVLASPYSKAGALTYCLPSLHRLHL